MPTERPAPLDRDDAGDPRLHAETVEQWRDWLATHHAAERRVWLVTWKKRTGRPAVTYDDAVTEALAWGWVDSVARGLDEERTMLRFTPRKPTSGWSAPNKERVARLLEQRRMQPPGQAAVDVARANGSWTLLDDVERLVVPDDLAAELDTHPGARDSWESFPRSVKRGLLEWVVQAKRPETRRRRVAEIATRAARGERARP